MVGKQDSGRRKGWIGTVLAGKGITLRHDEQMAQIHSGNEVIHTLLYFQRPTILGSTRLFPPRLSIPMCNTLYTHMPGPFGACSFTNPNSPTYHESDSGETGQRIIPQLLQAIRRVSSLPDKVSNIRSDVLSPQVTRCNILVWMRMTYACIVPGWLPSKIRPAEDTL